MDWWVWLLIVVLVIGVAVAGFAWLQARRRSGGVISGGHGSGGDNGPGAA